MAGETPAPEDGVRGLRHTDQAGEEQGQSRRNHSKALGVRSLTPPGSHD